MTPSVDTASFLPQHLAERVRACKAFPPERRGSYILYWMHHAVRAHENPALDVAVWMGNRWKLPVLVYQGLGGKHPHNADRHHTFIMEGARDVQRALAERGIAYAFYLGRSPDAPSPLRTLADNAALVITEDFPAPPFPAWTQRLGAAIHPAVWAVDAHCIVPMQSLGKSYPRAFAFRDKTKRAFAARVEAPWVDVEPEVAPFTGTLGFDAIDFEHADIAALCAACEIDHSVGPVPHTRGGSEAGYARWNTFKAHGLASYARLRNDAAVPPPKGVSRLSPYLHHGHVSPFRIAREAAADGSAGAEKYLDELLVWRELAYNFCFYNKDVETLKALPAWARETLATHATDEREATYSWEQLARGQTGDPLWDAAQQSLLIHGTLHNNVRMTWGKALLRWTHTPEEALQRLIDLNHRYALDGSDPNSYAGILWCLGLFDRPFKPEIPIYGTIRPRPTEAHARRLDMARYTRQVARPARADNLSVAVIGAGLSGLMAARTLADHGLKVHVFDKARGPGGRMATRRRDDYAFDHGAQYFTARDDRFRRSVEAWVADGLVEPWNGRIATAQQGRLTAKPDGPTRYVGVPRMSALTRHLSTDLAIQYQTRVGHVERLDDGWRLCDDAGQDLGRYDVVLVTTPPVQAAPLLAEAPTLAGHVEAVTMRPCWAVMAVFDTPLPLAHDGLFIHDAPVSWAARNNSKPGRPPRESWVLHGAPSWSDAHLEADTETVANHLLAAFFEATGLAPVVPRFVQAHRWRYALADNPLDAGCLWDADLKMGVCADWCNNSRVEGAFLSGMAVAGRVLGLPDPGVVETVGVQAALF